MTRLSRFRDRVAGLSIIRSSLVIVFIIGFVITVLRLIVIHHYIGWRFLWGDDEVPILNFAQFFKSVFSLGLPWRNLGILFIPQLSFIIVTYALHNFFSSILGVKPLSTNMPGWIVNSVWFFIGTLTLWYVVNSLDIPNKAHKIVTFASLSLFFAFNPWATIDTFKSYLGSTSISSFLTFVLMAFYVKLVRHAYSKAKIKIYEIIAIIAIIMVLYSGSPASAVRSLAFLFQLDFVLVLIIALDYLTNRNRFLRRNLLKAMGYAVIPFIISLGLIYLYKIMGYFAPLHERVISLWHGKTPPASYLYPPYAITIYSLMGMTSWIAHSIYMPYHSIYERGIVAALMMLWPILGLGAPIYIIFSAKCDKYDICILRRQILFILILALISIAWGTALHQPFSSIKSLLISRIPLITQVWPWGLSFIFIKFAYLLLTSYVVGYIVAKIINVNKAVIIHKGTLFKTSIMVIVFLAVISPFLYTSIPILDGKVFGQYYNENIKGFNIPSDYLALYNLHTQFYEHVLLLPEVSVYSSTKWGWQGTVAWYHWLNPAILVRTIAPFSQYTDWNKIYSKLARPCLNVSMGFALTKDINIEKIRALNGKIISAKILNKGYLSIYAIIRKNGHIDIILPLKKSPLNISGYKFIKIFVRILGRQGIVISPWLFIYSGNYGGVHILSPITVPGSSTKTYVVGEPDKPWPSSRYNPSRITGFILRLRVLKSPKSINNRSEFPIVIILGIIVESKASLCTSYSRLLETLNIKYIAIDKTLQTYTKFYKYLAIYLRQEFESVYNGKDIDLFKTNTVALPFHIIPQKMYRIRIIKDTPSHIIAKITINKDTQHKMLLIFPMLYSKMLPNPLRVRIKLLPGHYTYRPKAINYNGLTAYEINESIIHNCREIIVNVSYSKRYLAMYIAFIVIDLIPLILFITSIISYLRYKIKS